MFPADVEKPRNQCPHDPTLNGEPAIPNRDDLTWVLAVVAPIEEKHLPDAGAYQTAEKQQWPKVQHVVHQGLLAFDFGEVNGGTEAKQECQQEQSTVGADRKCADVKPVLVQGVSLLSLACPAIVPDLSLRLQTDAVGGFWWYS